MKSYILRPARPVQPQDSTARTRPAPASAAPLPPASTAAPIPADALPERLRAADHATLALVEQILATGQLPAAPAAPNPATSSPPAAAPVPPRGPALYVGLDVHSDSIAVSLAQSDSTEVRRYGLIGGTHDDVTVSVFWGRLGPGSSAAAAPKSSTA